MFPTIHYIAIPSQNTSSITPCIQHHHKYLGNLRMWAQRQTAVAITTHCTQENHKEMKVEVISITNWPDHTVQDTTEAKTKTAGSWLLVRNHCTCSKLLNSPTFWIHALDFPIYMCIKLNFELKSHFENLCTCMDSVGQQHFQWSSQQSSGSSRITTPHPLIKDCRVDYSSWSYSFAYSSGQ